MATNKMNLDLVGKMVTNYKTKQYNSIVTNKMNPMAFDAQSVWLSIEALKGFINTIETEVAKNPEYGLHDFGLRFYYSAYPENNDSGNFAADDLAGLDAAYQKLHTVIAIPTALINGNNQDFDPCDPKTYDGTKPSGEACAIMAENHGTLIPPNPAAGTWF